MSEKDKIIECPYCESTFLGRVLNNSKRSVSISTLILRIELFVLFVTFLVLKLTGVINWSWWIVVLPITIPFACFCAGVVLVVVLKLLVR